VGASPEADGASGVDVVRPVLGVVLNDENGGLRPVGAVSDAIDELAKGPIIVGHGGDRRGRVGTGALGVVFSQTHHDVVWEAFGGIPGLEVLLELVEFREKHSDVV